MMNEKDRIIEIYRRLKKIHDVPTFRKCSSFEALILTILSQNTNDNNRDNAYEQLLETFEKITPEILAGAEVETIRDAIKVAGLHNQKSARLKNVSQVILDEYDGSVDAILERPLGEAREILVGLKGVGYKTADILLLFHAGYLTLPVDTHITRLSKRLGFAPVTAKYEEIRKNFQKYLERSLLIYKEFHLLLIEHGRATCKAIKPACSTCILEDLCPKIITKKPKKSKKKS
ncbi:MAG: endonuclease III domain-containing protein [Candidatus Helarchaeota archaeon]